MSEYAECFKSRLNSSSHKFGYLRCLLEDELHGI